MSAVRVMALVTVLLGTVARAHASDETCPLPTRENLRALSESVAEGVQTPGDPRALQLECFRRWCENGDGEACGFVASLQRFHPGLDDGRTLAYIERACSLTQGRPCYERAEMLANGLHRDDAAAREAFAALCSAEPCAETDACDPAGDFFLAGRGGERSVARAVEFYGRQCPSHPQWPGCPQWTEWTKAPPNPANRTFIDAIEPMCHPGRPLPCVFLADALPQRTKEFLDRACRFGDGDSCMALADAAQGRAEPRAALLWLDVGCTWGDLESCRRLAADCESSGLLARLCRDPGRPQDPFRAVYHQLCLAGGPGSSFMCERAAAGHADHLMALQLAWLPVIPMWLIGIVLAGIHAFRLTVWRLRARRERRSPTPSSPLRTSVWRLRDRAYYVVLFMLATMTFLAALPDLADPRHVGVHFSEKALALAGASWALVLVPLVARWLARWRERHLAPAGLVRVTGRVIRGEHAGPPPVHVEPPAVVQLLRCDEAWWRIEMTWASEFRIITGAGEIVVVRPDARLNVCATRWESRVFERASFPRWADALGPRRGVHLDVAAARIGDTVTVTGVATPEVDPSGERTHPERGPTMVRNLASGPRCPLRVELHLTRAPDRA